MPVSSLSDDDWDTLLQRIEKGKCTPFLGTELSSGPLPAASQIATELAAKCAFPVLSGMTDQLSRVTQFMAAKLRDRMKPREAVVERLGGIPLPDFTKADDPHGALAALPLPIYVTTNYDDFMVHALKARLRNVQRDICGWHLEARDRLQQAEDFDGYETLDKSRPVVFHLFGSLDLPESMVLTEDDYLRFLVETSRDPKCIPNRILQAARESSVLFLGYRPSDLDFRVLLWAFSVEFRKASKKMSVQVIALGDSVAPSDVRQVEEILQAHYHEEHKIEMRWVESRAFIVELRQRWENRHVS